MNKSKKFFISMFLLGLCYFCGFQVRAMNIGKNLYRVCKNDVFIDYDQQNTKKIVTEVKQDGSFVAEDLGSWIEKQNFYNISVVEEEESYKKMYYESDFEVQEETNRASDEVSYIHFAVLVEKGDVIRCTDSWIEKVIAVKSDGSFYTETEEVPAFLADETE